VLLHFHVVEELIADLVPQILAGIIDSSIWDKIGTTLALSSYLDDYKGDSFVMEMMNPLSTGQSVSGCSRIDDDVCQAPDCTTTTEGTGWKYCTALSIANLNGVSPSKFQYFHTEVPRMLTCLFSLL
jgi:hypothetical protein